MSKGKCLGTWCCSLQNTTRWEVKQKKRHVLLSIHLSFLEGYFNDYGYILAAQVPVGVPVLLLDVEVAVGVVVADVLVVEVVLDVVVDVGVEV